MRVGKERWKPIEGGGGMEEKGWKNLMDVLRSWVEGRVEN